MNWIKTIFSVLVLSCMTILVIDFIAFQFRKNINPVLPMYGVAIEDFSRGYPIDHFKSDQTMGFDINPGVSTYTTTKPIEYKPYEVWGNSYGCFDDEWAHDELNGGIYLAGDSFTWGYADYESKFGTLLEDLLNTKVYACGVTHTGQGHQFEKFLRLFKQGLRPSIVVVNIYTNDLDNDYFFPHTHVHNGYMVENVETCGSVFAPNFHFQKRTYPEVVTIVEERSSEPESVRSLLRQYSLTANIIAEFTRKFRKSRNSSTEADKRCSRSVYVGINSIGNMYLSSELTAPNRKYISNWISHSEINEYLLLFSFIPSRDPSRDTTYPYIKQFISENRGYFSSFNDFCDLNCRTTRDLYYESDSHFNETGNLIYAKYLMQIVSDFMSVSVIEN